MEYSFISPNKYKECSEETDLIVSEVAAEYKISKADVRYQHVINHLYSIAKPTFTICFSNYPSTLKVNYPELNRFNYLLNGSLGLNVTCSDVRYEKPSFVRTVSGLTLFVDSEPILFLNSSTDQSWNHVIFTILHELMHIYDSKNSSEYQKAAALIGNYKYSQNAYPSALQPLEDETNVKASLLCAPSCSFKDHLLKQTFYELSTTYSMSWAALHNRIFNFFYYELGWDKYSAKNAVFAFRNADLDKIRIVREKIKNDSIDSSKTLYLPF